MKNNKITLKAFIMFNALIGVYMVFKSVGFSYDNILAGFAGMGHTYLEVLFNFSKRLFNWFFELFDYKVVPNVPNNPPSAPTSWWSSKQSIYHPRGLDQAWRMNLPDLTKISSDLFNPGINININTTPWYKDFSTLLWIGGIASVFGACYFGYKFLVDPTFIESINIFKVDKGKLPETQITPASPGSSTDSISELTKSIFLSVRRATYKLNPYYWFLSSVDYEAQHNTFILDQSSKNYNNRLYPFTEYNPFRPWYHRIKVIMFGESVAERLERLDIREQAWKTMIPTMSGNTLDVVSAPFIGSLGLELRPLSPSLTEATSSFRNTLEAFRSVTPTPRSLPINLPDANPFEDSQDLALSRLLDGVVNTPNSTIETFNKYNVLDIE
jgi:hypothetical protein